MDPNRAPFPFPLTSGSEDRVVHGETSQSPSLAAKKVDELTRLLFSSLKKNPEGALLAQLQDLKLEEDNKIFWSDLYSMGWQLLRHEQMGEAMLLLDWISHQPLESTLPDKIRIKAKKVLATYQGKAALGQRLEPLFNNLSGRILDPAALGGMIAGGFAFRLGRFRSLYFLRSRFSNGLLLRAVGAGAGLSAEVPTFLLTSKGINQVLRRPEDWSSATLGREGLEIALLLGCLRLSGWGTRGMVGKWVQGTSPLELFSQRVLPQLGMWTGIMGAHYLQNFSGMGRDQDGPGVLFNSLVTLLHFNLAGAVLTKMTPQRLKILEWQLEQDIPPMKWENPFHFPDPPDSWAVALVGSPLSTRGEIPTLAPIFHINNMPGPAKLSLGPRDQVQKSSSYGDLLIGEKGLRLKKRFLPLFPPSGPQTYSTEIIESALLTPSRLPDFHERLLEAYVKAPNCGTRGQLYTAMALENIFKFNPVETSGGSFDQALIQIYTVQALSDGFISFRGGQEAERLHWRQKAMNDLFQLMDDGYHRADILDLFDKYQLGAGFTLKLPKNIYLETWNLHPEWRRRLWNDYRPEDRNLLYAFVIKESFREPGLASRWAEVFSKGRKSDLYPSNLIDQALDFAREHPKFAHLILRRLAQVFATRNLPAKLREISHPSVPGNNFQKILDLMITDSQYGEGTARLINGSYLTGWVDDIRLARKVVSVVTDIHEWVNLPAPRQKAEQKFTHAVDKFNQSGKKLTEKALMKILLANSNEQTRSLYQDWKKGRFEFRIISAKEHDLMHEKWGKVEEYDVGLFSPGGGKGGKDAILIREMPATMLGGREEAFIAVKDRILSLIHEWEHWRHFSNHFEGLEKASRPFSLDNLPRKERIVTEMMSYLEEQRWRVKNLDVDAWQIAHRLGDNLVSFLRDLADKGYYGRVNESFSGN